MGQAAALDVELAGGGHLGGVLAPRLAPPAGLQVLPPAGDSAAGAVRGTAVEGEPPLELRAGPQRAGVFRPAAGRDRPTSIPKPARTGWRPAGRSRSMRARPGTAAVDPELAAGGGAAGAATVPGAALAARELHAIRSAALPAERGRSGAAAPLALRASPGEWCWR